MLLKLLKKIRLVSQESALLAGIGKGNECVLSKKVLKLYVLFYNIFISIYLFIHLFIGRTYSI